MPWPAFNELGDLPIGVYRATLAEVVAHFKEGSGFVWVPWCGDAECEMRIKAEAGGVTVRTIDPGEKASGKCLVDGKPAKHRVALARAY